MVLLLPPTDHLAWAGGEPGAPWQAGEGPSGMNGWDEGGPLLAQVAGLGADRLARILVDHAVHDPGLEQALRLALAAQGSDAELARSLAGEVDALSARRSRWIDGNDQDLAHGIDRIRAAATRDLLSRAPRAAADLHLRLIWLHPAITAQVRDSDGAVGSAVEDVVADFGLACAALPAADRRKLPAEVAALLLADDTGVCRRLIHACKDGLGPDGLAELDRLFRAGLDGVGLAGGAQHRRTCLDGLTEVADARDDVDAFIEVQELAKSGNRAVLPIAERLVGAGRLDEALQRLEQATGGEHRTGGLDDLRVEVLDRLGRVDDAQAVRWGVFLRTLSGTMLDAYLERVPAEVRPDVTEKAVTAAREHRDAYAALSLLSKLAPDAAAGLVRRRLPELSGDVDIVLRPASERLAVGHPLAAVLLRRQMADAALARARTQTYDRVVQDLLAAEYMAVQVGDWQGVPAQNSYREAIARQHRAKTTFWTKMNAAGLSWRR